MSDKTFSVGEVLSAADVNEYLANGYWKRIDRANFTSGSPVTSHTFSSLSSEFRLFRLTFGIVGNGSLHRLTIRLNNDAGSNYSFQINESTDSFINSTPSSSQTGFDIFNYTAPVLTTGEATISKISSGTVGMIHTHELAYASAYPTDNWWHALNGIWNNTSSLINRIDVIAISGTFYGTLALEGMVGI